MSVREPESPSEALLPLVVDEGQQARAEGMVLRLGGEFCIVVDGGTIVTSKEVVVSASLIVGLRAATSSIDLGLFEGRQVVAKGLLQDHLVVLDGVDSLASRSESGQVARLSMDRDTSFVGGKHHLSLPLRSSVERALMAEGLLLDLWKAEDNTGGRRIALAADVETVRAALSEQYGDSLDVIQSRWSEATLKKIDFLLVEDGLARSVGREIGSDHQMKVAATLLHLPKQLARRLDQFPAEALALEVLVRPA